MTEILVINNLQEERLILAHGFRGSVHGIGFKAETSLAERHSGEGELLMLTHRSQEAESKEKLEEKIYPSKAHP